MPQAVGQRGTVPIGLCPPKCEITNCTIRSKHAMAKLTLFIVVCTKRNQGETISRFLLGPSWCELGSSLTKKASKFLKVGDFLVTSHIRSMGKVMFSQACVILLTEGENQLLTMPWEGRPPCMQTPLQVRQTTPTLLQARQTR